MYLLEERLTSLWRAGDRAAGVKPLGVRLKEGERLRASVLQKTCICPECKNNTNNQSEKMQISENRVDRTQHVTGTVA